MTSQEVRDLRARVQEHLDKLKIGFKITVQNSTYGQDVVTFRVECGRVGADGTAETAASRDFRTCCHLFGLKPEDLGRTFRDARRQTYKIIGLKPASFKYPVLCERQDGSGRIFKLTADAVKRGLATDAPVPRSTPPGKRSDAAILADLRKAYLDLSPENLTADGEIRNTMTVARRRKDAENRRDRFLEELGRQPSESELWP